MEGEVVEEQETAVWESVVIGLLETDWWLRKALQIILADCSQ